MPIKVGADGSIRFETDGPVGIEIDLSTGEVRTEIDAGPIDIGLTDGKVQLDTGLVEIDLNKPDDGKKEEK